MKKILLLALVGIFLLAIGTSRAYTIEANSVFINDSNAYISAEPHTLYSSGYVTFTVQPKEYTGDVNVIWGFNTSQTIPTSAELYHPHNVSWNTSSSYSVTNVNGFWETTKPCDYGNEYNTYKREVNYTLSGNNTTTTEQKVFCFDSWSQEGSGYTVYWHTEHTKQVNWVDVSQHINSIEHDFDGKNKWYYATNLPVVAGHTYILRSYIKIPVSLEGSSGKYDFAIYPSSYGTNIGQAISNGHFYYLDPWWNSSWNYCRDITLAGPDSTLTDYPAYIHITNTTHMDRDSLRFVDAPCNEGGSELDFEVDSYATNDVNVWVRIPSLNTSGKTISVYYNNSGISNGEDADNTWESDYKGVWHMNERNATDSSGNNNDGEEHGTLGLVSGEIGSAIDLSSSALDLTGFTDSGYDHTFEYIVKADTVSGTYRYLFDASIGRFTNDWGFILPNNISIYDGSWKNLGPCPPTGEWLYVVYTFDSSSNTMKAYINGSLQKSNTYTSNTIGGTVAMGGRYTFENYFDGKIDEARISSTVLDSDRIKYTYLNIFNQSDIVTIGSEETPIAISGTVKDASGNAISGARVYILYQNNNSLLANLTTNATGGFEYSTSLTGNFSICAYNPTNVSQGGSCKPFVEVT